MKEKALDGPEIVEQIQQNTYDRKNKENTIPEALKPTREEGIKEELIHRLTYTGKYGTRPKAKSEERNCRYCNAPNWNPNHECTARESKRLNC